MPALPVVTELLDAAARAVAMSPCAITEAHDAAEWDAFVSTCPGATTYHRWAWRDVFARAFGHEAVYLCARRDGHIVGVLPIVSVRSRLFGTFGVSLPFVNYGGVLAADDMAAAALAEHAAVLAVERGWSHVELRHTVRRFEEWPVKRHKVAMRLSLPESEDALWQGLDRKVRNQVRKAEKNGCSVEEGGAELLDDFYAVFARNMRDLGTPVYARVFFAEVLRAFPEDTRVFVVRSGTLPIAASVVVGWRRECECSGGGLSPAVESGSCSGGGPSPAVLEVPWASSLRAHADKSPNMLLYRSMLEWAIGRGYRTFDFGRSTPGEGTFQFKKQWGAEPVPLAWEYVGLASEPPDQGPKNPKFRAAIAVWQRLPLGIANTVGPHIARQIP